MSGRIRPEYAGNEYYLEGNEDRAIADYTKAIELRPDYVDYYLKRGNTYGWVDSQKAIADFGKVIKLDSNSPKAYRSRAERFLGLGKWEDAVSDLTQVIELNCSDMGAYQLRAMAYETLGEYAKAIADFNKAIKLCSEYEEPEIEQELIERRDRLLSSL